MDQLTEAELDNLIDQRSQYVAVFTYDQSLYWCSLVALDLSDLTLI